MKGGTKMLNKTEKIIRKLELIDDVVVNYRGSRLLGIPDDKAREYAMSGVVDAINELSKEINKKEER